MTELVKVGYHRIISPVAQSIVSGLRVIQEVFIFKQSSSPSEQVDIASRRVQSVDFWSSWPTVRMMYTAMSERGI